jgi:outer membrane protein OmpA-like peptidoglycan-associated protein
MTPRFVLAPALLMALSAAALAQTGTAPTVPPAAPPQIAPKPAEPTVTPAPPSQLQSEFAIAAGDTVMFPYQSNQLTLRSLKILDNQASWLKARPEVKVTLEAYCDDDIEPAKAREFCLTRARSVRDYLVKQGVPSERMTLVAFDDTQAPRRPAKADKTKAGATKTDTTKPDASKTEADKADAKKAKKDKKDEKARRTNRRVSTRVAT